MNDKGKGLALLLIIGIAAILTGCDGDDKENYSRCSDQYQIKPVFTENQVSFTDGELLSAGYSSYSLPQTYQSSQPFPYSAEYLCNWDTTTWENRGGPQVPLLASDSTSAQQYVELVLARDTIQTWTINDFVAADYYFEFNIESDIDQNHQRTLRVVDSDVIALGDVSWQVDYWRFSIDPYRFDSLYTAPMRLVIVPQSAQQVESIVEDFYYLRQSPMYKVLSSFTIDLPGEFVHQIYSSRMVYGDWGLSDIATLFQTEVRIDKATGTTTMIERELRDVQGCRHPNSIM